MENSKSNTVSKKNKKHHVVQKERQKLPSSAKSGLKEQIIASFCAQLAEQSTPYAKSTNEAQLIEEFVGYSKTSNSEDIQEKCFVDETIPPYEQVSTLASEAYIQKLKQERLSLHLRQTNERFAIDILLKKYAQTAHMGILDPSYRFFVDKGYNGMLCYKVYNNVAVVAGDPLCDKRRMDNLLKEFKTFCYRTGSQKALGGWDIAFMGASNSFAHYARQKQWTTIHFGWDRFLNPSSSSLLSEKTTLSSSQKRMLTQNRSLLNSAKGNLELCLYIPSLGIKEDLQEQLRKIYDDWRNDRNQKRANAAQAFITVYDPFFYPKMMVFVYLRDRNTKAPKGFAALRKLGAQDGYQLDPYIAAPDCPLNGISELLVYGTMTLLEQAKIKYMSFGIEPLAEVGEINGISGRIEKIIKRLYKDAFSNLPLDGKKGFHDKFKPEDNTDEQKLHLIFPEITSSSRYGLALAKMAHVSIRKIFLLPKQNPETDDFIKQLLKYLKASRKHKFLQWKKSHTDPDPTLFLNAQENNGN